MRRVLPVFFLGLLHVPAQVQTPVINQGATAAYQALRRLTTTATVLHTTAHPDDEDGALLVWLSRNQGVRTGLFTLNRGEGGANLIGSELFDALGVLRTEELLAAGRYYGVDQFFTRATDFGFSKRMDETLEMWGREEILRDCVRVIRLYRPDIIVSRFVGGPRDGHGNHATAGLMSKEVFRAAADPNRFPEHLKEGLRPWQVKKLYQGARGTDQASLTIDVGEYDPQIGASYRQVASTGLSLQRSQGTGARRADPGPATSGVQLVETVFPKVAQEGSLFHGLDTTIESLARLAPELGLAAPLGGIAAAVARAIRSFDAREPSRALEQEIVPALRRLREVLAKVREASFDPAAKEDLLFRLANKEREFVDAGNKLLGLSLEVLVDPPRAAEGVPAFFQPRETFAVAIPGQQFTLTATVINRGRVKIDPVDITLHAPSSWKTTKLKSDARPLAFNDVAKTQFDVSVPENAEYTRPYWSRKSEYRDHIYQLDKPQYQNLPWAPPDLTAQFRYTVADVEFAIERPAQTVYMDRRTGEQRRILTVAPALSVAITPKMGVIQVGARNAPINVRVRVMSNVKGEAAAKIRLVLPAGWSATPAEASHTFTHEGEIRNMDFRVAVAGVAAGKSYTLEAVAEHAGRQYREGYDVIAHPDLEPRHLYGPATTELSAIDVKVAAGLKAGYIMGVGDEIPESLEQIGVKVQMLTSQDLSSGDLSGFDTILVGIRASAVRDDYKAYNSRLLDYVRNGGNLIVQYQTPEFDAVAYGPYPFKMTRRAEEVSEENSKVTILEPRNAIFQGPNPISAADFDDWVEERGSKFMSEWDARYTPLLECHDREQAPQKGGMLQARYGKGTFTYAAYAFYRQLPAAVPGAFRLFANMISLGKASR